jgi:hypothetical protein
MSEIPSLPAGYEDRLTRNSKARVFDLGKIAYGTQYQPGTAISTIQTLMRKKHFSDWVPPAFIFIDEYHGSAPKTYRDLLKLYPNAEVLGPRHLSGSMASRSAIIFKS